MKHSKQLNINEQQKRQTIAFSIWGGIAIAAVLVITTLWVAARAGTHSPVSKARISTMLMILRIVKFLLSILFFIISAALSQRSIIS